MAELVQGQPTQPQNQIDEAKRQKLLELVRGRALARPTDLADDEVMVWPSLVVVEAVCASVFLLILTFLSIFVNAPLLARANPNQTPNPSKAPWYFLNMQELLLHMDPGLAGVIIPSLTLGCASCNSIYRSQPPWCWHSWYIVQGAEDHWVHYGVYDHCHRRAHRPRRAARSRNGFRNRQLPE